jgi:hypothetical protein
MLNQWWSELDRTERALILGGGFTAVSAIFMGAVVARGLRSGIPVTVKVGSETRGLIADQVRHTNLTLDRLSSRGIPVYVLVGAKRLEERRG